MVLQNAVPLLLLVAVAVLAGVLALTRREADRSRRRLAALESYRQDLLNLVNLARRMSSDEIQAGPDKLLGEAVRLGYAAGATLYTRTDAGNLEVRATAGTAAAEAEADIAHDLAVSRTLESPDPFRDAAAGRVYIPLRAGGGVIGVVFTGLSERARGEAGQAQLAFLEGVVALVRFSLDTLHAFQRQLTLSTTDGLTGVNNHRHFQHLLSVMLAQSYLQASPLTLILFDIDHFKKINDTHGHLYGDLVLREIANTSRRHAPPAAVVARYGGEEFAIALPGVSVAEGAEFAEQLRQYIANHTILDYQTGNELNITVSAGVAAYQLGQGKSRLIARADEALYASKRGGRNRVTVAEPDRIE